jgi:PTH1 family peptidyl-tRNA hydrolase
MEETFDISKFKLIVGLGNPEKEYDETRHNAGFMFLDDLVGKDNFQLEKKFKAEIYKTEEGQIFVKPTTFMNLSGDSVRTIKDFYKILTSEILVIYDDLDLRLGNYKIQFAKTPKSHNGIISVENKLGTTHFWRIRIGVDNRTEELRKKIAGFDYVLGRFSEEELILLQETFDKIKDNLKESIKHE